MKQPAGNLTMHSFDTYKFIKIIKNAGLTEEQAEAIVNTVAESREYDFSKLASKDQLELLDNKIKEIKQQMVTKDELSFIKQQMATKEDFHALENKIHAVESSLLKWLIPFIFSVLGMLATVIFKLFSH